MGRIGLTAVMALIMLGPRAVDAASLPTPVPTNFTIRGLEPQPGYTDGGASGLNNWGNVAGSAFARPALFANHQVIPYPA